MKPETRIVQACLKWLKLNGGDGFHVSGSIKQRKGEPDITGEYYDDVIGWIHIKIEVKTETGVLSPLQIYRLETYSKSGYCTGVVTSLSEFKQCIQEYIDAT